MSGYGTNGRLAAATPTCETKGEKEATEKDSDAANALVRG